MGFASNGLENLCSTRDDGQKRELGAHSCNNMGPLCVCLSGKGHGRRAGSLERGDLRRLVRPGVEEGPVGTLA